MKQQIFYFLLGAVLTVGLFSFGLHQYDKSLVAFGKLSILSYIQKQDTCGKWNNEFPCVNATYAKGVTFPICTYKASKDNLVSGSFLAGSYWELGSVHLIVQQLKKRPGAIFIDIGANIGAFTLGVAHATKRPVFAVEPNRATMTRLRRSICLGKLGDQVTLIHGAVSDTTHKEVRLAQNQFNRGVSLILEGTDCKLTRGNVDCMNETIKTITLNDILNLTDAKSVIMKVDAEGSEIKIFKEAVAGEFFDKIDVPLVFMEVVYFTMFYARDAKKAKLVNEMMQFFYKRNYKVASAGMHGLLGREWAVWPTDVVFIKQY